MMTPKAATLLRRFDELSHSDRQVGDREGEVLLVAVFIGPHAPPLDDVHGFGRLVCCDGCAACCVLKAHCEMVSPVADTERACDSRRTDSSVGPLVADRGSPKALLILPDRAQLSIPRK
jgi:hypothetical protein